MVVLHLILSEMTKKIEELRDEYLLRIDIIKILQEDPEYKCEIVIKRSAIKIGCYQTFVSELNKILKNETI